MIDSTPAFVLGFLVAAVIAIPAAVWQYRRLTTLRTRNQALGAEADKRRAMLAAAPDGLYIWDDITGEEYCSRRLAVLLDLAAGTNAQVEDVLYRFEGEGASTLHQAIIALRREGREFDLLLRTSGGRRIVHAVGVRCATPEGRPMADLLWMRDAAGHATDSMDDGGTLGLPGSQGSLAASAGVQALLDALPIPVWLRDARLDVAFANQATGGDALPQAGRDLAVRVRDGGAALAEPRLVSINEASRLFEITEIPIPGLASTVGIAIDRSAAEETEGAFARETEAQAQVLENLRTAMAVFGPDTRLKSFNTAYTGLWHLDAEWLSSGPELGQILERLREQRRLPEYADFRAFKDDLIGKFTVLDAPAEELMHLPDGTTLHSVVSPHPLGGLIFAYENVTDRLTLERSFNTLIAVQQATLDNLYEGVAVFGSDGRLKLSNPAFAQLWNMTPPGESPTGESPTGESPTGNPGTAAGSAAEEALHVSDFIEKMRPLISDVKDWPAHKQKVSARLLSRHATSGRLVRGDGTVLEYANVPLPDGAVLLSYLDITDRFRVENALRQRAEAMTEASRLKSEFIANVSHEIRTPLTTVTGFAEMLAGEHFGPLNARQAEYSHAIVDSSRGLMSVINDILDLASIEAGILALELDAVELHSTLAGVFSLIRERARHKNLKLDFDCPPDIGWMVADATRLKQVVFNLLSNAVQFTPPQGTVGLAAARDDDNVIIAITDTGIGIPQADQDRVFGTFEQVAARALDHPMEGDIAQGGAGLGLSLVKRFIEMHGGTVDMRSIAGKGTIVTCTLPAGGA